MQEIPKQFNFFEDEEKIYALWEKSGFFNPDNLDGDPYSIMMPPPNVTGVLHLGHSLENTLMDVMARYQRMKGKKVLLLPGTDHAAVATQAKVEKILTEKGIKNPREELGREKLLEEIRNYAENSKAIILQQIKKMGTSCDWSRLAYTFDEKRSQAVNETFKKMYDDGLIYRGFRVVNWSVNGQSTCSDDELVHIERQAKLYTFKYSKDFPISISTTRPETKLGDTAVAVNPGDKHYKKYIGQFFKVDIGAKSPLEIKIIADENVDMDFGTGALGVTPAHSAVDFEMYEKQKARQEPIGLIQVIGNDGKMTMEAGDGYAGLSTNKAREKFVAWLEKNDLLEKSEDIAQNVGTSDRFGDVVEALPMTQWFVDVNKIIPERGKSLKDLMREAVSDGENKIKINPERFKKIYLGWIDNLRDWCISRQIWWGHRVPVWYKDEEVYVGIEAPKGNGWIQDEDTLDTWFSSGLWTFSTLGWPEKTDDLKTFHPTNWMQMGYEILFFWMARMILMSGYLLNQIPFKNVYIHGMLRDEKGNKFSKSSGNSVDPLEISEKYGTDALRLSLVSGVAPGQDLKFYLEKVEGSRNFVTKLWNIFRYCVQTENFELIDKINKDDMKTLADKWIISELEEAKKMIGKDSDGKNWGFMAAEEFSLVLMRLRRLTRDQFADEYVEENKIGKNPKVLGYVLNNIIKMWHPFMPFVTEKMWQTLKGDGALLMMEKWLEPQKELIDKKAQAKFADRIELVSKIGNIRASYHIDPAEIIEAYGSSFSEQNSIEKRARIKISPNLTREKTLRVSVKNISLDLAISKVIDTDKEIKSIEKEIENLENLITKTEALSKNENFLNKANADIINATNANLNDYRDKLKIQKELEENLKSLL